MTFADTEHGTFAGLGHAVSDSDTGTDLTLLTGEAVSVTITGCRRGCAGSPGALRGEFGGQQPFGDIKANTSTGVYGVLTNSAQAGENIPVANLQEVYPGEAEIVTTISGQTAQRFAVRIERVNMTASDPNRNLLLRITDPELLRATGGIVHEWQPHCTGRLPGRRGDPCAGQRPNPRLWHLCCNHAETCRCRAGKVISWEKVRIARFLRKW